MDKDQKVLIGLIGFIFLVVIGIGIFLFVSKRNNVPDANKFKNDYESLNNKTNEVNKEKFLKVDIDENNLYVYKTDEEVLDILRNGTGIIFFGFAKCSYCRTMVNLLDDLAKEYGITQINYLDIQNIRDTYEIMDHTAIKINNGTDGYYELLNVLSDYLTDYYIKDADGNEYSTGVKRLYSPTVVVVKNGSIVGFHEGTVDDTTYNKDLNDSQKEELKEIYEEMIKEIAQTTCVTSNC